MPMPEICIVFNGGAAGDFFTCLVSQQYHQNHKLFQVDATGMIIHPDGHSNMPGDAFKEACREFYNKKFLDTSIFDKIKQENVVNTHWCHSELLWLFPNCEFYYIDDYEHVDITVDTFIKKRLRNISLSDWVNEDITDRLGVEKYVHFTDEQVKKIKMKDWRRNVESWKKLGLNRIDISEIVNKEKCRILIKNIVKSEIDHELFDTTYDLWAEKNLELLNRI